MAVAASVAALVAACGGAETTSETGPPRDRCTATCADLDLRGPVAARAIADVRVAIAVGRADGALVYGEASLRDGRWDPESLIFREVVNDAPGDIAAVPSDDGLLVAHGTAEGVVLTRVDMAGATQTVMVGDGVPASIDLVSAPNDTHFCAFIPDGVDAVAPSLSIIRGELAENIALPVQPGSRGRVALALTERGVVVAYASQVGLQLSGGPIAGVLTATEEPTLAVAAGGVGADAWVAWAETSGVFLIAVRDGALGGTPRLVDDGARTGEPAHRVGAALTMLVTEGGPLLAYQDQTVGALVTAHIDELVLRQAHADGAWTRGLHTALVQQSGRLFALDVALRGRPEPAGALHTTALR